MKTILMVLLITGAGSGVIWSLERSSEALPQRCKYCDGGRCNLGGNMTCISGGTVDHPWCASSSGCR
jgi:hypothetical protein